MMAIRMIGGVVAILVLNCPLPTLSAPPLDTAPQSDASVSAFTVNHYRVEGNTLLSNTDLDRAVAPYLGEAKSSKDVEAARHSLEQLYHDRGFLTVLVNIPAQDVVSGIVRLR